MGQFSVCDGRRSGFVSRCLWCGVAMVVCGEYRETTQASDLVCLSVCLSVCRRSGDTRIRSESSMEVAGCI